MNNQSSLKNLSRASKGKKTMRPTTAKSRLSKGPTTHASKSEKELAEFKNDEIFVSGKEMNTQQSVPQYRGLQINLDDTDKNDLDKKNAGKRTGFSGASKTL